MGTPDFSVPALQSLAREGHDLPLVITQPDRPVGRGRKLAPPPVKQAAESLGIDVFQPEKVNTPETIARLKTLKPDFFVVVAFGQILSQEILDIPAVYPINIHASLLPAFRGSSPIQAAILNMEKQTGITTMVMDRHLDTGDILLTSVTDIGRDETAQELHDRLAIIGADLITKTIQQVLAGTLTPRPQDHSRATYAPLLKKQDGRIQWNDGAETLNAFVRGMTPWPGAFTFLDGKRLKIFRITASPAVSPETPPTPAIPGTITDIDNEGIHVATGNGTVIITELQGASGKRMNARAFLRGNPLTPGSVLDA